MSRGSVRFSGSPRHGSLGFGRVVFARKTFLTVFIKNEMVCFVATGDVRLLSRIGLEEGQLKPRPRNDRIEWYSRVNALPFEVLDERRSQAWF